MDDLEAFWRARLDEDEAWAMLALSGGGQPDWRHDHEMVYAAGGQSVATTPSASIAPHIARHDPARALRDVAADRTTARSGGPSPRPYRAAGRLRSCRARRR